MLAIPGLQEQGDLGPAQGRSWPRRQDNGDDVGPCPETVLRTRCRFWFVGDVYLHHRQASCFEQAWINWAIRLTSTLPPLRTTAVGTGSKYLLRYNAAARAAAPAPSTKVFNLSKATRMAEAISSSLTVKILSTYSKINSVVSFPGLLTAIPSAMVTTDSDSVNCRCRKV